MCKQFRDSAVDSMHLCIPLAVNLRPFCDTVDVTQVIGNRQWIVGIPVVPATMELFFHELTACGVKLRAMKLAYCLMPMTNIGSTEDANVPNPSHNPFQIMAFNLRTDGMMAG